MYGRDYALETNDEGIEKTNGRPQEKTNGRPQGSHPTIQRAIW